MKNFYETYNKMEKMVLGIILLFLIIMGFVSVICRFVLHMPLAWSEEIIRPRRIVYTDFEPGYVFR